MKHSVPTRSPLGQAFTLVEMLVVIAIIGILAALLFPAFNKVSERGARAKARAELQQIEGAIERYHAKYGHYPPDNPGLPALNQLFYELQGTKIVVLSGITNYQTLDSRTNIPVTAVPTSFGSGVGGFVNCTRPGSDDSTTGDAIQFIPTLTPSRYGFMSNGIGLLTTAVGWPANLGPVKSGAANTLNPFRYNSSSPTHNPKSYDLWVDILAAGKTNRISNWNRDFEIAKPVYPE